MLTLPRLPHRSGEVETKAGGIEVKEKTEIARIQLVFADKPDEAARRILKATVFGGRVARRVAATSQRCRARRRQNVLNKISAPSQEKQQPPSRQASENGLGLFADREFKALRDEAGCLYSPCFSRRSSGLKPIEHLRSAREPKPSHPSCQEVDTPVRLRPASNIKFISFGVKVPRVAIRYAAR